MHDSAGEAKRCDELHLLQAGKVITALEVQPKVEIIGRFQVRKRVFRPAEYWPDFSYIESESGKVVYEDWKGFATQAYQLKRKLFMLRMSQRLPDADWEFREMRREGVKVY